MAFWDVLFVTQDLDVSPDEAVDDAPPAVNVGSFHDYAVLYLGVEDGGVVAYDGGAYDGCSDLIDLYDSWFKKAHDFSFGMS